jgi:hypothetical protein
MVYSISGVAGKTRRAGKRNWVFARGLSLAECGKNFALGRKAIPQGLKPS